MTSNESILDSIEEGILIIDKNLKIVNANSHMLNALNLDKRDVIGKPCYSVTHCNPPDDGCPLFEALKTGKPVTKRCAYIGKNGSKVHKEVAVYPLMEGENTGKFIHIERDVTERVWAENEIKRYIDTLRKRVKGEALA